MDRASGSSEVLRGKRAGYELSQRLQAGAESDEAYMDRVKGASAGLIASMWSAIAGEKGPDAADEWLAGLLDEVKGRLLLDGWDITVTVFRQPQALVASKGELRA